MEKVGRTLALPGSSEHNTGLAVDLGREGDNDVSDDFYKTPESRWLCANAADFGFILRYPRLKEQMTGIDGIIVMWALKPLVSLPQAGFALRNFCTFTRKNISENPVKIIDRKSIV